MLAGTISARRPPAAARLLVGAVLVAASTGVTYALKEVAPVVSLGVVYLPAVFVISAAWGAWPGAATSFASALAFNFFHLPPVGRFTITEGENVVALGIFLAVAVATSNLAHIARARASEAERRREEADLAADLARVLLGGELRDALPSPRNGSRPR